MVPSAKADRSDTSSLAHPGQPDPKECRIGDFIEFSRRLAACEAALSGRPRALTEWRAATARELANSFIASCRALDVHGLLEVGAFKAEASRQFVERRPASKAVAVEANPWTFARFTGERTPDGMVALNLAVADTRGRATLRVPAVPGQTTPTPGNASLLSRTLPPEAEVQVLIEVTTVDDLVEAHFDHRSSLAIWIDAEEMAHEVIRGAVRTLRSRRVDLLFVEVEAQPFWAGQKLDSEVERLLREAGLEPIARDAAYHHQYNCLYSSPQVSSVVRRIVNRRFAGLLNTSGLLVRLRLRRHLRAAVGPVRRSMRRALRLLFGEDAPQRVRALVRSIGGARERYSGAR